MSFHGAIKQQLVAMAERAAFQAANNLRCSRKVAKMRVRAGVASGYLGAVGATVPDRRVLYALRVET